MCSMHHHRLRPEGAGPGRDPPRAAAVRGRATWLAVAAALAVATAPWAEAATPVPRDLALTLRYAVHYALDRATATLAFLGGDVALDIVAEDAPRLFASLETGVDPPTFSVRSYGRRGDAWVLASLDAATLDDLRGDDRRYAAFADLFLLMFAPTWPLHPCIRSAAVDGPVTDGSSGWACTHLGVAEQVGRGADVWRLTNHWADDGGTTTFSDADEFAWIDREFGVLLQYEAPAFDFSVVLVAIDADAPDAGSLRAP